MSSIDRCRCGLPGCCWNLRRVAEFMRETWPVFCRNLIQAVALQAVATRVPAYASAGPVRADMVVSRLEGFVSWGDRPSRYNGGGEPCDMSTGPCCCGATHTEGK